MVLRVQRCSSSLSSYGPRTSSRSSLTLGRSSQKSSRCDTHPHARHPPTCTHLARAHTHVHTPARARCSHQRCPSFSSARAAAFRCCCPVLSAWGWCAVLCLIAVSSSLSAGHRLRSHLQGPGSEVRAEHRGHGGRRWGWRRGCWGRGTAGAEARCGGAGGRARARAEQVGRGLLQRV